MAFGLSPWLAEWGGTWPSPLMILQTGIVYNSTEDTKEPKFPPIIQCV